MMMDLAIQLTSHRVNWHRFTKTYKKKRKAIIVFLTPPQVRHTFFGIVA